jgi:hypothetical protein
MSEGPTTQAEPPRMKEGAKRSSKSTKKARNATDASTHSPRTTTTTVINPIHMLSWTREGAPGSKEGNGKNFN